MIISETFIIDKLFFALLMIRFVFKMRFRLHCFHLSSSLFYSLSTCNVYVFTNDLLAKIFVQDKQQIACS
jgi:hypothetical protein